MGAIKAECQVRVKHFWPELATKSLPAREALLVLSASALRDGKREREREGTALRLRVSASGCAGRSRWIQPWSPLDPSRSLSDSANHQ